MSGYEVFGKATGTERRIMVAVRDTLHRLCSPEQCWCSPAVHDALDAAMRRVATPWTATGHGLLFRGVELVPLEGIDWVIPMQPLTRNVTTRSGMPSAGILQ